MLVKHAHARHGRKSTERKSVSKEPSYLFDSFRCCTSLSFDSLYDDCYSRIVKVALSWSVRTSASQSASVLLSSYSSNFCRRADITPALPCQVMYVQCLRHQLFPHSRDHTKISNCLVVAVGELYSCLKMKTSAACHEHHEE